MLNGLRCTFVLFLHAQRRPLELGFDVMINCGGWKQQLNYTHWLLSRERDGPNSQTDFLFGCLCFVLFPNEGTCVLLCIFSPVLPQGLCFSTCPPDVLPHASVSRSLQQLWLISYSDTLRVPERELCAAEWSLRRLFRSSVLKSCFWCHITLKHLTGPCIL